MDRRVVPSVFSIKDKDYVNRYLLAGKLSNRIHVDVMDGQFVNSKSPSLGLLSGLDYGKEIDVHLMVRNPSEYIGDLKILKAKRVYVHIEIGKFSEVIEYINSLKKEGFLVNIAINPETNVDEIIPYVSHTDGCLIMSVRPGREGQGFILGIVRKIREVLKYMRGKEIAVDGGINLDSASMLKAENVNVIVSGSFVANSKNPELSYTQLKEVFCK